MNYIKFLEDDKGNFSITRLGFILTIILIIGYSITLLFITVDIFHIQIFYALIAWNLALVGIKNHKDWIIKKNIEDGKKM